MVEESKVHIAESASTDAQTEASSVAAALEKVFDAEKAQNAEEPTYVTTGDEEWRKPVSALAELDASIAAFKAKMDLMTAAFVQNLQGLVGFKEPEEYVEQVKVLSPEKAAEFLNGKKKIAIMTGAGISAASGIPTFRG